MIENHFRPTARRFCECGVSFLVYWGLGSKAKAQSRDHRRRHRWKRLCLCLLLWVEQESKISPMLHPQRSTHDSTHQTVKEAAILHRRHSKPPDEGLLGFFFPIPLRSGSQLHLRRCRQSYEEKGWLNSTRLYHDDQILQTVASEGTTTPLLLVVARVIRNLLYATNENKRMESSTERNKNRHLNIRIRTQLAKTPLIAYSRSHVDQQTLWVS